MRQALPKRRMGPVNKCFPLLLLLQFHYFSSLLLFLRSLSFTNCIQTLVSGSAFWRNSGLIIFWWEHFGLDDNIYIIPEFLWYSNWYSLPFFLFISRKNLKKLLLNKLNNILSRSFPKAIICLYRVNEELYCEVGSQKCQCHWFYS